jgi:hypothetical protein
MPDFHNIKSHVSTIHTFEGLNNYYDKIFCEGVFFTLEDIYKLDRIFCINYEHHSYGVNREIGHCRRSRHY